MGPYYVCQRWAFKARGTIFTQAQEFQSVRPIKAHDVQWDLLKKQWHAAARQRHAAIRAKRVQYNEDHEQSLCNTRLNRSGKQKKFHQNGDRPLDEGQACDVQWELLKKQWHADAGQRRAAILAKRVQYNEELEPSMPKPLLDRMGEQKKCHQNGDRQSGEGQVSKGKDHDGGFDHLLILAQSAELLSESEVCFHEEHRNDENSEGLCTDPNAQKSEENLSNATSTDQKYIGTQNDGLLASANVGDEQDGICCQAKIPRLSQIRRQARSKTHFLVQDNNGEYTDDHLQGRTPRLSQIRRLARSRHLQKPGEQNLGRVPAVQGQTGDPYQKVGKCNLPKENGVDERHINMRINQPPSDRRRCQKMQNTSKQSYIIGHQKEINNRTLACRSHRFVGVSSDLGQRKEQQRLARHLRALKISKRRGQLRTEHIDSSVREKMHALEKTQVGLTGLVDPHCLSYMSMMSREQNLVACQQELLGTFAWNNEMTETYLGATKMQGQHMVNQPWGQMHNGGTSLLFPILAMPLREYCCMPEYQQRSQQIDEKMALKNMHKDFNNCVLNDKACPAELDGRPMKMVHKSQLAANSLSHEVTVETEKKSMCQQLSQLKREVRMGIQHDVTQQ